MAKDVGHMPDPAELALLAAAQFVVIEAVARLDAGDIEGALDLYTDDFVLEGANGTIASGKEALRESIMRNAAAGLGRRACHVLSNIRGFTEGDVVIVDTTQVAYLLESPAPYRANSIHNVRYFARVSSAGNVRIVGEQVPTYQLK
jgi:SnoaL-like domain